jgi:putative addiction module antidote
MTTTLTITKIGNSARVVLPKALLDHLGATVGDQLVVTRTSRGLELSKDSGDQSDDFEHQMAVAREVMERDRYVLAALAKS